MWIIQYMTITFYSLKSKCCYHELLKPITVSIRKPQNTVHARSEEHLNQNLEVTITVSFILTNKI
ncbi:hypothetical protein EV200_104271 [Pedobacter psychrotolerans]|uniref:Uncharacterized protein n=1 Tax=Pedobacter psychrotolerans TaxID=1843235 RepID=A0A4R2HD36_9SPHI|nr:hypothetical protein EV200_104271 [Pedobacter psychrotolerans]